MAPALLSKGAEGYVSETLFLKNPAVVKERKSKRYRIAQIDSPLRLSRTLSEAKMLCAAKQAGVLCPLVLFVDSQRMRIVLQKLRGNLLSRSSKGIRSKNAKNAGELLGLLHSAGICHGDYTTTNLMLCKDGLYVIDFGLSGFSLRIEDYATDLLLYKKSVPAAEFSGFLSGYKKTNPKNSAAAIRQLCDIEGRGRYIA
ncbi:MAG: KEOPS complex kinase/ATPase Bud32 [Candidatus Micrarchaeia archaeon]